MSHFALLALQGEPFAAPKRRVDTSMFYPSAVAEEEKLSELKRRFFALAQTGCHDAFVAAAIGGLFSGAEKPGHSALPKAIDTAGG